MTAIAFGAASAPPAWDGAWRLAFAYCRARRGHRRISSTRRHPLFRAGQRREGLARCSTLIEPVAVRVEMR